MKKISFWQLFIPKQKIIFLFFVISFLIVAVFIYLTSQYIYHWPKPNPVSWKDYENCSTEFCGLIKEVSLHPRNLFLNTLIILKTNLQGVVSVLLDTKYLIFAPIIYLFSFSSEVGLNFYNNIQKFIFETFFPHGFIEIVANILTFSLYYALIANILLFFKQKFVWKLFFRKIIIQLVFIAFLFTIAAFLESLAIYFKS